MDICETRRNMRLPMGHPSGGHASVRTLEENHPDMVEIFVSR
jgi:hypothetical protein